MPWLTPCLIPKKYPATQSGIEIKQYSKRMAIIVPKGTAPDAPEPMRKRFRRKTSEKTKLKQRQRVSTRRRCTF